MLVWFVGVSFMVMALGLVRRGDTGTGWAVWIAGGFMIVVNKVVDLMT